MGATGSWVQQMTSGWLILELTNSPLMLGLNGLFMSGPFLVMSLYGGALADRMDRRRLLLISQTILVVLALVPGVLSALGVIKVWHIYALNFMSWSVGAFDAPARQALIPSLVPEEELMTAIALTSVLRRVTALVGPLIGGVAITTTGIAGAFFVYAFCQALVFLSILPMRSRPSIQTPLRTSMASSIAQGLASMRGNPIIFGILSIEAVHTFFATYHEIMPVFARDVLKVGPSGLGFLYASPGVGALLGTMALVAVGNVTKKGRLFMITALVQPLIIILFALSPWMGLSMLVLVLIGALDVVGGTVRNAMLQLSTEEQMRGRVMGMNMMVHRGLSPVSGLQSGTLATFIGAPLAVTTGATIVTLYTAVVFLRMAELHRYTELGPEEWRKKQG